MKFLLWAALAAIIVFWLTRSKKIAAKSHSSEDSATSAGGAIGEPMVQCAHCGTHVPASESVKSPSGKVFCTEEHRLQYGNP